MTKLWSLYVAVVATSLVAACSSAKHHEEEPTEEGVATQSVCPSSSPPTYESFGRAFMEKYCTRCHSSAVTGPARQNAPLDHDFDTLAGVIEAADHIDENAAAGPAAINHEMPNSGPLPTEEERRRLGEWLACEKQGAGDAGVAPHTHHH